MTHTVLIIEDEKLVRWSLKEQLTKLGYSILESENSSIGKSLFLEKTPDIVLLDIKLPDGNGLDLLSQFQKIDSQIPVIIMTGHGNVEVAIEAMKRGALNYIDKPFNIDELDIKIKQALEKTLLARELKYLRKKEGHSAGFDHIISFSEKMKEIILLIKKVCKSPSTTVLLQGESGTGKDVVARAIHANSDRSHKPFMNITCSAMPDQLLESELFGHEKGAFTDANKQKKGLFELADGGTIFLDELGETSKAFQAKLLRVLEEKSFKRVGGSEDIQVNVRIISATNRDLENEVDLGNFREDLFYRLNIMNIQIPPLRERKDDIVPLTKHFILKLAEEFKRKEIKFPEATQDELIAYDWPGNIRELRNAVERALIFCEDDTLKPEHFSFRSKRSKKRLSGELDLPTDGLNFEEDVEKIYVTKALKQAKGRHGKAAALLGMNRDQIRYRIKKFELSTDEYSD